MRKSKEAINENWMLGWDKTGKKGVLQNLKDDASYNIILSQDKYYLGDWKIPEKFLSTEDLPNFFQDFLTLPVTTTYYKLRKDFRNLSNSERSRFINAYNKVESEGIIKNIANGHQTYMRKVHGVPQFLPWHRWVLSYLEKEMQKYDPDITLPYWDWTREEDQDFSTLLNGVFGSRETKGEFESWNFSRGKEPPVNEFSNNWINEYINGPGWPNLTSVVNKINNTSNDYTSFRILEFQNIHQMGHNWVGGHMGRVPISPRDPLFYLHHCNIDRIWALWQLNYPDIPEGTNPHYKHAKYTVAPDMIDLNYQNAVAIDQDMTKAGIPTDLPNKPGDVLSHRNLGYGYEEDLRLKEKSIEMDKFIYTGNKELIISPNYINFDEVEVFELKYDRIRLVNNLGLNQIRIQIEGSSSGNPSNDFSWTTFDYVLSIDEELSFPILFEPKSIGIQFTDLDVVISKPGFNTTRLNIELAGCGIS